MVTHEFKLHLFARFREVVSADQLVLRLENPCRVADVRAAFAKQYPALCSLLQRSAFAVNGEFADEEQLVNHTDELALIPPVSGGRV